MLPLHDQLALAHAVFACIAVLFTLPIAILAGRYLRPRGPVWFRIHRLFAFITAVILIPVFGLGLGAVWTQGLGASFGGPGSDLHHKVGLSVFLLVFLQVTLGIISHNFSEGHLTRKIHIPLGIVTVALLYWQTWEGLHNEWMEMSVIMTNTPNAVQVIFWIFFLGTVMAYGFGAGQVILNWLADNNSTDVQTVPMGDVEDSGNSIKDTVVEKPDVPLVYTPAVDVIY